MNDEKEWLDFLATPEGKSSIEKLQEICRQPITTFVMHNNQHYYENELENTHSEQWEDALNELEFTSPEEYRSLKVYFLRKIKLKDWQDILSQFNNETPRQGQRYCSAGEKIASRLGLPMPKTTSRQ